MATICVYHQTELNSTEYQTLSRSIGIIIQIIMIIIQVLLRQKVLSVIFDMIKSVLYVFEPCMEQRLLGVRQQEI